MQRYDLFINSEAWLINKEAEKMLQTLVEKNTGSLIYTFVFLTTTMDIYRFDLLRGQFIEIPYNLYHNRQFDWPMKARQMVEDGEPK